MSAFWPNGPLRYGAFCPEEVKRTGVEVPDAPWLGDIINDKNGMIQIVKADRLLPKAFMTSFFAADEQAGNGESGDKA